MSRRSRIWPLTAAVILAITAASAYYGYLSGRFGKSPEATPAVEAAPPHPDRMKMPGDAGAAVTPASSGSNQIFISPERQQLIGARSVPAEYKNVVREIRTVGRISFDETKIAHIHTKIDGFIEEVFVDYVGKAVRRGDPLFTIYSPELVATQQEYLLALKSNSTLTDSAFPWIAKGAGNLLEATRRRLLLWDVTPREIEELEKTGQPKQAITIYSPVDGIVTERQAYHHGRRVTTDTDLYTIVDLSSVWILGQVFEYDLPFLKLGQTAQVDFPYSGAKSRTGKIAFISPTLDPKTRTAEVRLEFPNPDFALRPDQFVNFGLKVNLGRQLVVPQDAILQTGTEQYVFVDKGQGYFEPRTVKLGPEAGDDYAIESGLKEGERVVTAATFILDSESRLKGAFANMGEPTKVGVNAPAAAGQNLSVEVLQPTTAKVGGNSIRIAVKDASGKPIEGGDVEVTLFMPQMGNMAPMTSKAGLKPEGNGVYSGTIDFPMAWTWDTTVAVTKNGQPVGSAKTTITAR